MGITKFEPGSVSYQIISPTHFLKNDGLLPGWPSATFLIQLRSSWQGVAHSELCPPPPPSNNENILTNTPTGTSKGGNSMADFLFLGSSNLY